MEKVHEKECAYRNGDSGVKYLMRGPTIDWGLLRLKPGEKMGGHGHREVEETFFFFRGSPTIIIDDVPHQVEEGAAYRLSPGEKHDILNETGSVVDVLFMKVPYLPDDKITD